MHLSVYPYPFFSTWLQKVLSNSEVGLGESTELAGGSPSPPGEERCLCARPAWLWESDAALRAPGEGQGVWAVTVLASGDAQGPP